MKKKSQNIENANKTHRKNKHHIKSISNDDQKKRKLKLFFLILKFKKKNTQNLKKNTQT
jgi:hypothetical protein